MIRKRIMTALLAGVFAFVGAPAARADEGMWTFGNIPKEAIKQRYKFKVTDAWLKRVQMASIRFDTGGSGAFVSADGLVLTNHHVASETLSKISTPERDFFKEGFLARTRDEEIKSPDLELSVLASFEDVTARVNGAAKADMPASDANRARKTVIAEIETDSLEKTGLRSEVVAFFQGGQYVLYRYKKYTDVRLVFAPEFAVAFFGGHPDNFTFPRYDLDIALFRVYEDNRPIRVENYFRWSKKGSKEGDLAFVSGHPASTQRLSTMATLEFVRDDEIPFSLEFYSRLIDTLKKYSALGSDQELQAHDDAFGYQNAFKALSGRYEGLKDEALMAKKRAAEDALRKKVAASQRMTEAYGDAWDTIARTRESLKTYNTRRRLLDVGLAFNGELFYLARLLVRQAAESKKPNAERLKEFTDSARPWLEMHLYSEAPIYPQLEQARLTTSLSFMVEKLGADDPTVRTVLAGKSVEERAAELVGGTRVGEVAFRKQVIEGGQKAIDESTDPMIVLARSIDVEARGLRKRYEDDIYSVERQAYTKVAQAVFEIEGASIYPDATFSLRLSYGAVRGYRENGVRIAPYTTMAGMFEKSTLAGNKDPYRLPQRWLDRKDRLNLGTPFNLVSTNDITGGNSGSPVFNKKRELIGLVFDGNIQSLVGNFIYDDTQNRTVSVDSRVIIEALTKIYDAHELVKELTGK